MEKHDDNQRKAFYLFTFLIFVLPQSSKMSFDALYLTQVPKSEIKFSKVQHVKLVETVSNKNRLDWIFLCVFRQPSPITVVKMYAVCS